MAYLLAFIGGCALLAFVAWARAGRSPAARWWPGSSFNESAILGVLPAFGLMCVIGTLMAINSELVGKPAEVHPAWALVWLPLLLAMIASMALGIWGLVIVRFPERMFPKWAWPKSQSRKDKISGVKRRKRRRERWAARRAARVQAKGARP